MEAIKSQRDDHPDESQRLRRDYDSKIGAYPCRSFNLGKQSLTYPHVDHCNLSHGWCAVTPLGNFTHQTGGHLVLWDFGLVIDFPAGSTILIPSSIIVHSNTAIKEGEKRYAVVQYVSGGLFRWVKNGYMTQHNAKGAPKEGIEQQTPEERWAKAVQMFTNISELAEADN